MSRFRTAATRWKQTRQVAGVDALPTSSQLFAALMYFSGFLAGLEAAAEISRLPRRDAAPARAELQAEVETFHQIAAAALASGAKPH